MGEAIKCSCGSSEFVYTPETNEAGWQCYCGKKPGEPEGFCPQLDRDCIDLKAYSLLMTLHNADLLYVSNGDEGDALCSVVAEQCRSLAMFDQYTICRLLFEMKDSHCNYWKRISQGVLSGKDPRDRCHCGALATVSSGKGRFCLAHDMEVL